MPSEKEQIRLAPSASKARKLGKKVTIRADWDDIKVNMMRKVLLTKFTQNTELGDKLIATNDVELIEGNNWKDEFWGKCPDTRGKLDGKNKLGELLMDIRAVLSSEYKEFDLSKEDLKAESDSSNYSVYKPTSQVRLPVCP